MNLALREVVLEQFLDAFLCHHKTRNLLGTLVSSKTVNLLNHNHSAVFSLYKVVVNLFQKDGELIGLVVIVVDDDFLHILLLLGFPPYSNSLEDYNYKVNTSPSISHLLQIGFYEEEYKKTAYAL